MALLMLSLFLGIYAFLMALVRFSQWVIAPGKRETR
jgi:hypothetical protein